VVAGAGHQRLCGDVPGDAFQQLHGPLIAHFCVVEYLGRWARSDVVVVFGVQLRGPVDRPEVDLRDVRTDPALGLRKRDKVLRAAFIVVRDLELVGLAGNVLV
jgi:hypothetical protein